jgi:hypothetical protein
MPAPFEAQADLVRRHPGTVLASAGMAYADAVSLRFYPADPAHVRRASLALSRRGVAGPLPALHGRLRVPALRHVAVGVDRDLAGRPHQPARRQRDGVRVSGRRREVAGGRERGTVGGGHGDDRKVSTAARRGAEAGRERDVARRAVSGQ